MPEEIEVPTEHLHEAIHEEAHAAQHGHGGHGEGHSKTAFTSQVALSSALMAVLAAGTALLAGHHANEGVLEAIKASNRWSYFQSKSIKAAVLASKRDLIVEMGKEVKKGDEEKLGDYEKEKKEIQDQADELDKSSEHHMEIHQKLARTVTYFQIAIALSAIAVLTRKQWLWFGSLALMIGGAVTLAITLLH